MMQASKSGSVDASLIAAADHSLAVNGARSNIGDYHADMKFVMADGQTSIEHDVVTYGTYGGIDIKINDHIDINLLDSNGKAMTLTIREIWADNGGGGQMAIADTTGNAAAQAVADAKALPVMYEWSGANVRVGVRLFGDDHGTADYAHIISADGTVTAGTGEVTDAAVEHFDEVLRGGAPILQFAIGMNNDDDERDDGQPAAVRAAPAAKA